MFRILVKFIQGSSEVDRQDITGKCIISTLLDYAHCLYIALIK